MAVNSALSIGGIRQIIAAFIWMLRKAEGVRRRA
jgi:hypothetical protein